MREVFSKTGRKVPESGVEIDDIYKTLGKYNESHAIVAISSVLEGSVVVKKETPQNEASHLSEMELMRLRADERRYQRSISSIPVMQKMGKSEFKSASESIAFAAQLVLAFGSAFLCGYYLGEYFFGFEKEEHKYILGGTCSFLTLILESVLFIIRDSKVQMKRQAKQVTTPPGITGQTPKAPSVGETELKATKPETSMRKRVR
jgi:hypothetical protein